MESQQWDIRGCHEEMSAQQSGEGVITKSWKKSSKKQHIVHLSWEKCSTELCTGSEAKASAVSTELWYASCYLDKIEHFLESVVFLGESKNTIKPTSALVSLPWILIYTKKPSVQFILIWYYKCCNTVTWSFRKCRFFPFPPLRLGA